MLYLRIVLAAGLLSLSACDASAPDGPSIDGRWTVSTTQFTETESGPVEQTVTRTYVFNVDDDVLTGTLSIRYVTSEQDETSEPEILRGTYVFPDLSFAFSTPPGAPPPPPTLGEVNAEGTEITVFSSVVTGPGGGNLPVFTLRRP